MSRYIYEFFSRTNHNDIDINDLYSIKSTTESNSNLLTTESNTNLPITESNTNLPTTESNTNLLTTESNSTNKWI